MSVTIEPIALKHAAALQDICSDPDNVVNTNVPVPYPVDGALKYISQSIIDAEAHQAYIFTILLDGDVVGNCGVMNLYTAPSIGYFLRKDLWGKGYATEAVKLLCVKVQRLGISMVHAKVRKTNIGSQRVLEKNLFIRVGERAEEDGRYAGETLDVWEKTFEPAT